MYCPKCGAQNIDDAQFCRACGANISLVPQALTGRLPNNPSVTDAGANLCERPSRHRKEKEPPSLEKGITSIFIGIAFILISLAIWIWTPGGFTWWFWMLIPAFALIGGGIGKVVRWKYEHHLAPPMPATAVPPAPLLNELPSRDTSQFLSPPTSVTEGTTRHLGAESTPKSFGSSIDRS